MKIFSSPIDFETDKKSYLDFILCCSDYRIESYNKVNDMLFELSQNMPIEYVNKLCEFETLVSDNIIDTIASLDCVKILLDK